MDRMNTLRGLSGSMRTRRSRYPDRTSSVVPSTLMTPISSTHIFAAHPQPQATDKTIGFSASSHARAIITLVVGGPTSPSQEAAPVKFFVHEPLLLKSSPVFRVMLSTPNTNNDNNSPKFLTWDEAISKEIRLPEDRVEDWEMMCQWLYSGGSKRNTLAESDLFGTDTLTLARMRKEQPGLEDLDLEKALEEYISWCAARDERRRYRSRPRKRQHVSRVGLRDLVAGSVDVYGNVCWYDEISIQAAELQGLKRGLQYPRHDCTSSSSNESTNTDSPRPKPPAFGRLIRLYILADKYAIEIAPPRPPRPDPSLPADLFHNAWYEYSHYGWRQSLQGQIILRVRAINKLANAVPDKGDVERLWENIVDEGDSLKGEVMGMYMGMDRRSFENIFRRGLVGKGDGVESFGDVARDRWRSGTRFGSDEDEDEEWHCGFLRELLLRKVAGTI